MYSVNPFIYSYLLFGSYFAYSPSSGGIGGWQTNNYPGCGVTIGSYCPISGYLRNDYGSASGNNYVYSLGHVITGYAPFCVVSHTPRGPIVSCGARPVYSPGGETAPLTSSGTGTWQQNIGSAQASAMGNANACTVSAGYIYCPATGYSLPVSTSGAIDTPQSINRLSSAWSCNIEGTTIYCISDTNPPNAYFASASGGAVSGWSQTNGPPAVPSTVDIGGVSNPQTFSGVSCYTYGTAIYCLETAVLTLGIPGDPTEYYNYYMYYAPISGSGIGSWTRTASPYGSGLILQNSGITQSGCNTVWNGGNPNSVNPFSCVVNGNNLMCIGGTGGHCYISGGLLGCTNECNYPTPYSSEATLGSSSLSWYQLPNYPNGYTGMSIV